MLLEASTVTPLDKCLSYLAFPEAELAQGLRYGPFLVVLRSRKEAEGEGDKVESRHLRV